MAANQGQIYETKTHTMLDKLGMVSGGSAGASHNIPDVTLLKGGKHKSGCELKNKPTAAGSLVMQYVNGKWKFGDVTINGVVQEEKLLLKNIGIEYKILDLMNGKGHPWGKNSPPILQYDSSGGKIVNGVPYKTYSLIQKAKFYKGDRKKFPGAHEVKQKINASSICDYYIAKGCSYMNVESHGFYTLNDQDDLGLNAFLAKKGYPLIPDFAASVNAAIRVRMQPKSLSRFEYQFTFTLTFTGPKKSPYNLSIGGNTAKFIKTHLYEALQ
jgi:hypothetical protein